MQAIFDSKQFSKTLKQKRLIDEDVDMRTLAEKLNISPSTISRCENGFKPDLDAYAKLCHWLGKPMQTFIKIK